MFGATLADVGSRRCGRLYGLASVAAQRLRTEEEDQRLNRWRRTDAGIGTIFLDSMDELGLTRGSFATACRV